jgi:hypothetical protein
MGASPWFYFVDYQPDINASLLQLREREFRAGRYNPAEDFPSFPVDLNHAPGCQHANIAEAQEDADADGTRSILDIARVGGVADYGVVAPLSDEALMALFGTTRPNARQIADNDDLFEDIERGQGIYIVAYTNDTPTQIFFAGYSYD